ncbi:alkaline phosphatase D family protein [Aquihabitans sp. McL0605]|uniref:alkaline phosphatase D family protein n=1 Tax=Aquihabitans sp. McL0605 TaxID=3415671 RepID=UPI003CF0F511
MDSNAFAFGVASGDPLTDRVIIWTHVSGADTGADVEVSWAVATDRALEHVVAEGTAVARADRDHTVHVDVTGLEPATSYCFEFAIAGASSTVGRTRTLPAGPTERARFAMVSCAKFNAGFFNTYDRIADRGEAGDIDFLLHLGDYIYEASNTPPKNQTPGADIGRQFAPLHECVTLDDYRTRYRQYGADPSVLRLRAALPIIATLDDHELADGAWRGGADNHDEAAFGPWADRKAGALRAREEWLPVRRPDPDDPTRVFRSMALGDLADLVLTDARSRRDQPVGGLAMLDPERTALGAEQRGWLLDELSASTAAWRLWGNPSVLSTTFGPDLPEDLLPALRKLKLIHADQLACDSDQWDGYPAERDAILRHVEEQQIRDLVVLSGDIHVGLACEVHRDPFAAAASGAEPIAAELVTASITSQNLDDKLGYAYGGSRAVQDRFLETFPHARWTDFDGHGYVLIDVDRERVRGQWWFVDGVLAPSAGEVCASTHEVVRGSSRIRPYLQTSPSSGTVRSMK